MVKPSFKKVGDFLVYENDNVVIRMWEVSDKWNCRIVLYGSIHGFGRDEEQDKALMDANKVCRSRAKLIYKQLKERFDCT